MYTLGFLVSCTIDLFRGVVFVVIWARNLYFGGGRGERGESVSEVFDPEEQELGVGSR